MTANNSRCRRSPQKKHKTWSLPNIVLYIAQLLVAVLAIYDKVHIHINMVILFR